MSGVRCIYGTINFELFVYIALFPRWCNPAPPLLVCVCPPCPPWWARVFSLSSRVPLSCLRVGSYSLAPGYANENGSELFVLTRQEVVIEHNYLLSHLFILSYYSWLMNIIYCIYLWHFLFCPCYQCTPSGINIIIIIIIIIIISNDSAYSLTALL